MSSLVHARIRRVFWESAVAYAAMSFFVGAATNAAISFRHKEFLRI